MYVAYVDDSGITDRRCQFGVFAAAVLNDLDVLFVEDWAVREMVELVGYDRLDAIAEFKGRDLFRGTGSFEGIAEANRFATLHNLLGMFESGEGMFIAYGAVDRNAIADTVVATLDPADVALRKCLSGVEKVLAERALPAERDANAILVMDDTGDTHLKERLRTTFRSMRRRSRPHPSDINAKGDRGALPHFLDDFYFGASRDCMGLQIADLCAYFIGLHLRGVQTAEPFYQLFAEHIQYSEVFPPVGFKL